MNLKGEAGRVYGPVGQSRSVLPVGRFGGWTAEVETHAEVVPRIGPMVARRASPAVITGSAGGWRPDLFFWSALSGEALEVELREPGPLCWRFPAKVAFGDGQITFKSTGQAICSAAGG